MKINKSKTFRIQKKRILSFLKYEILAKKNNELIKLSIRLIKHINKKALIVLISQYWYGAEVVMKSVKLVIIIKEKPINKLIPNKNFILKIFLIFFFISNIYINPYFVIFFFISIRISLLNGLAQII